MKVVSRYTLNGVPVLVLDEGKAALEAALANRLELVVGDGRADLTLHDIKALRGLLADAEAVLTSRAEKAFRARNLSLDLS